MATAAAAATPSSLLLHRPSPAEPKVAATVRLPARAARISCTAVATPAQSSSAVAATDRAVYNFTAGPATLRLAVLQKAQAELIDYHGSGMSIMEMSHRGKEFDAAIKKAEADLRALLAVLDTTSFKAFKEAKKFSAASVAWSGKDGMYTSLPPFDAVKQNPEARAEGMEEHVKAAWTQEASLRPPPAWEVFALLTWKASVSYA
ncbi:hypothetical protein E2562_034273 [Oryza meyeriana var. granulata]|uniref:Aminotransferase class V domain-containing protein n=1 Tax=Oryza meyeriana var. granulata TaxID=110450 RepID=A0A6G1FF28_9ORYZ|nr:hypothetical protein E2562_034273 [Oryza meyeriana var. granulata]